MVPSRLVDHDGRGRRVLTGNIFKHGASFLVGRVVREGSCRTLSTDRPEPTSSAIAGRALSGALTLMRYDHVIVDGNNEAFGLNGILRVPAPIFGALPNPSAPRLSAFRDLTATDALDHRPILGKMHCT